MLISVVVFWEHEELNTQTLWVLNTQTLLVLNTQPSCATIQTSRLYSRQVNVRSDEALPM